MLDPSILLALTALMVYGLTQVLSKYALRSVNATTMVALNVVVSIPIYVVFLFFVLVSGDIGSYHMEYVLYGLIGASTARGGYYIFMEALEKGAVTMVGSVTASYPAITAVLAVTVLGEALAAVNALGVVIIIACMVALSWSHGNSDRRSGFSKAALVLSLTTMLIWGVGAVFIKAALSELPLVVYLGLYPFILPPIAFAYLRHKKATKESFLPRWTIPVVCAIMVAELWQLAYFAETGAVSRGAASIVYPLISAYPVVTIVTARFTLEEDLSRRDWLLLVAVVVGILLTSIV